MKNIDEIYEEWKKEPGTVDFQATDILISRIKTMNEKPINPIKSKKLKQKIYYAIKYRSANFKTAMDFYPTIEAAQKDFATIPSGKSTYTDKKSYCQGCGVGCKDEYEIVKVKVTQI